MVPPQNAPRGARAGASIAALANRYRATDTQLPARIGSNASLETGDRMIDRLDAPSSRSDPSVFGFARERRTHPAPGRRQSLSMPEAFAVKVAM